MKEKLLIITSRNSQHTKIKNGGTALTKSTVEALSEQFEVSEFSIIPTFFEHGWPKLTEYLLRLFYSFLGYSGGLYPWTASKLLSILSQRLPHYVFIDHSLYGRLAKTIKARLPRIRVITHFHNIEFLYYQNVSGPFIIKKILSQAAKHNEALATNYSDKIITLTGRDGELIQKYFNRVPDSIIPICLPIQANKKEPSIAHLPKRYLLFCGSYFKPNNEGIIWFIENVLPHIDIDIVVAGHSISKLSEIQGIKNVFIVNSPSSLNCLYANALAVIAPIFSGTGMKTKVIEALSYGKKVLATSEALIGIEYHDCYDVSLCDSDTEFIECLSLLLDESKRNNTSPKSQSSYELFLQKYSSSSKSNMLKSLFDSF